MARCPQRSPAGWRRFRGAATHRRRAFAFGALTALLLLAFSPAVDAQIVGSKLGAVHVQEVVEGSPDFERASEQWSMVLAERTNEIQARQEELREAERLLTSPDTPADDGLSDLLDRIERLRMEIERLNSDVQGDLNQLRQQLLAPIAEKVFELVQTYGEENGFDVIVDTSAPEIGLILAVQDIEITDELLAILRGENAPPNAQPEADTNPDAPR